MDQSQASDLERDRRRRGLVLEYALETQNSIRMACTQRPYTDFVPGQDDCRSRETAISLSHPHKRAGKVNVPGPVCVSKNVVTIFHETITGRQLSEKTQGLLAKQA